MDERLTRWFCVLVAILLVIPITAIMVQAETNEDKILLREVVKVKPDSDARAKPVKNKAPQVTLTVPIEGATVSGDIVFVNATAIDSDGFVTRVEFSCDGMTIGVDYYGADGWSAVWNTTTLFDGTHTVTATATDNQDAKGSDSHHVTTANNNVAPEKYALIVGISNYAYINDLKYCDDDANDWYRYLSSQGYNCIVLGDHKSRYVKIDALATRANVVAALNSLASISGPNTNIAIVFSGHGYYQADAQYFCCWDTSPYYGDYTGDLSDDDFAMILDSFQAEQVFFFGDFCHAGGYIYEIQHYNPEETTVFASMTCGVTGYGYDVSTYANGAWTYWFLEAGLVQGLSEHSDMEGNHAWADSVYPYGGADNPVAWDEVTGLENLFYL